MIFGYTPAMVELFKTKLFAALAVCALLAAMAIGLQFAGRVRIERAAQAIQPLAADDAPAGSPPAATVTSGLDLLRGPAGEAPASPALEASPGEVMKDGWA